MKNYGATRAEITAHYDVGTDFYRLWLDRTMSYSCALWEAGDDLERAQQRKISYIAGLAGAPGAATVLDIGCGFGGMLNSLVTDHGVRRAIGLTLSEAQAEVADSGDPRLEVRVESWADHRPAERYDAIVSVGAFEHFARPEATEEEQLEGYRAFFRSCRAWLRPEARMGLQSIAFGGAPLRGPARRDVATCLKAFPGSRLPSVGQITSAAHGLFEITSLRNDRLDYARTCGEWLSRLRARQGEAIAAAGQEVFDRFAGYLAASQRQFEQGIAVLLRIGLRRYD
jgi:cyclopropane-fatty-acyl-phospholipid synthase